MLPYNGIKRWARRFSIFPVQTNTGLKDGSIVTSTGDPSGMRAVVCPVCGSAKVVRRPTALNFSRVNGTTRTDIAVDVQPNPPGTLAS